MEINKRQFIGIGLAIIILAVDFLFLREEKIFYFIIGMSLVIAVLPFIVTVIIESSKEKEKNEMFLEFSRNLVESVKAGTPISKSIINLRNKYYGSLTPYIQKLANQISLGIPVNEALDNFSKDVNSKVIKRAVALIREAERAGGEVENILDSVAKSVNEIEKLKKERASSIYTLVVQGYVIFLVFIVIMLIMQFKVLPMTSEITQTGDSLGGFGGGGYSAQEVASPMFYLLIAQGLFSGLVIGKLAEGSIKSGIKHSFILVALSLLIYTGTKAFF